MPHCGRIFSRRMGWSHAHGRTRLSHLTPSSMPVVGCARRGLQTELKRYGSPPPCPFSAHLFDAVPVCLARRADARSDRTPSVGRCGQSPPRREDGGREEEREEEKEEGGRRRRGRTKVEEHEWKKKERAARVLFKFERGRAARFVRTMFSPSFDSPFSTAEVCVSGKGAGN